MTDDQWFDDKPVGTVNWEPRMTTQVGDTSHHVGVMKTDRAFVIVFAPNGALSPRSDYKYLKEENF